MNTPLYLYSVSYYDIVTWSKVNQTLLAENEESVRAFVDSERKPEHRIHPKEKVDSLVIEQIDGPITLPYIISNTETYNL